MTTLHWMALPLLGCAGPHLSPPPTPTPSVFGAWFGLGPGYPDGALCVMVCDNGRLFLADSACDRTDRGDFSHYIPYTRQGDRLVLAWDEIPEITLTLIDATHARFSALEFEGLPLDKVQDSPAWCNDPSPTPIARAQR